MFPLCSSFLDPSDQVVCYIRLSQCHAELIISISSWNWVWLEFPSDTLYVILITISDTVHGQLSEILPTPQMFVFFSLAFEKIGLHNMYLLSNFSWHFTIANLPQIFVCKQLDIAVPQYLHGWCGIRDVC